MNVDIVRNWRDFDGLESEWNSLLERSSGRSIFLTWEWIRAWRMAIDEAVVPFVVVVRSKSGTLLGLAPYYVASMNALGKINFRMLRFVADTATGAEYADWIVDASAEQEVAVGIAGQLAANAGDWDVIWMPNVAGWTGIEKRVVEPCSRVGLLVQSRVQMFSAFRLAPSMSDFDGQFSASRRQNAQREMRRVLKTGDVTLVQCQEHAELSRYLDALFDLHQRRWETRGQDGCFVRKPAEARFYRLFSPVALERGWLRIFGLKQGDAFKAVQFGYVFGDAFLQLQEGFDPSFQDGAGNVLRRHVVEHCIESGLKTYDFLGGISEHKRRWSAEIRNGFDILVGSPSWKTRLLKNLDMWPTGRFIEQEGLITA